jgi:hypothetical protein
MNEYISVILGVIGITILTIYFICTKILDNKEKAKTQENKNQNKTNNLSVWKIALGTFIGVTGAHFAIEIIEKIITYIFIKSII